MEKKEEKVVSADETEYLPAFEIISIAGDAKSDVFEAIYLAKDGDFDEARKKLDFADKKFIECHHIQTKMLNKEASGEKNSLNIVLIHALDHLTMTTMWVEIARELIEMLEKIKKMEEK